VGAGAVGQETVARGVKLDRDVMLGERTAGERKRSDILLPSSAPRSMAPSSEATSATCHAALASVAHTSAPRSMAPRKRSKSAIKSSRDLNINIF
jgi:hypothetical protein